MYPTGLEPAYYGLKDRYENQFRSRVHWYTQKVMLLLPILKRDMHHFNALGATIWRYLFFIVAPRNGLNLHQFLERLRVCHSSSCFLCFNLFIYEAIISQLLKLSYLLNLSATQDAAHANGLQTGSTPIIPQITPFAAP